MIVSRRTTCSPCVSDMFLLLHHGVSSPNAHRMLVSWCRPCISTPVFVSVQYCRLSRRCLRLTRQLVIVLCLSWIFDDYPWLTKIAKLELVQRLTWSNLFCDFLLALLWASIAFDPSIKHEMCCGDVELSQARKTDLLQDPRKSVIKYFGVTTSPLQQRSRHGGYCPQKHVNVFLRAVSPVSRSLHSTINLGESACGR